MRTAFRTFGKALAFLAITGLFVTPTVLAMSADRSITDNIENSQVGNWHAYNRATNKAWRHTPPSEVTKDNSSELKRAWMFLSEGAGNAVLQSAPFAVGVRFVNSNSRSIVWNNNGGMDEYSAYVLDVDETVVVRFGSAHTSGTFIGNWFLYKGLADGGVVMFDESIAEIILNKERLSFQNELWVGDICKKCPKCCPRNFNDTFLFATTGEHPIAGW